VRAKPKITFTNLLRARCHLAAAKLAWDRTIAHFRKHLA